MKYLQGDGSEERVEPRGDYRSRVRVRLHIVTDWVSGSDGRPGTGDMFDLPARIQERLGGLSGERFYGLDLSESVTNHDHGELLEMIEDYECEALRQSQGQGIKQSRHY